MSKRQRIGNKPPQTQAAHCLHGCPWHDDPDGDYEEGTMAYRTIQPEVEGWKDTGLVSRR